MARSNSFFVVILFSMLFGVFGYGQQFKMGKNLHTLKPKVLFELDDPHKAFLLPRVFNPSSVIGDNAYHGMMVFDSSRNMLGYYNGSNWVNLSDSNIYTTDGNLLDHRVINMGENNFSFASTTGNVGIGTTAPASKLQVSGAVQADSMLITAPNLYKPLNAISDSVAIIDSLGRVMKVGVSDILNAPIFVSKIDWVSNPTGSQWFTPKKVLGGAVSTYGTNGVWNNINAYVRMSNYMYAKDSIQINLDVYVTPLGTRTGIVALRLWEYADVSGSLIRIDTLQVFVTNNSVTPGFTGGAWNNGLSYQVVLDSNTRYVKADFHVYANNVTAGQGFRNFSIITNTVNSSTLNYVQGGNSFGIPAIFGTQDKQDLNIITHSTTKMLIDTIGRVGIGTTTPISKLQVRGAMRADSAVFMALPNRSSAIVGDSALIVASNGEVLKMAIGSSTGSDGGTNIYTGNGTLTGSRIVNRNNHHISFVNEADHVSINHTSEGQLNIHGASVQARTMAINNTPMVHLGTDATNMAFGDGLRLLTTGVRNTAIGGNAQTNLITGNRNIAIGDQALFLNANTSDNIAIGVNALNRNTGGDLNTAIGNTALNMNSSGANNTAIGYASLTNNMTASNNTAVGYESMRSNLLADENTALGYQSLFHNTTGTRNIALGAGAGRNTTMDMNTNNNIFLGVDVGILNGKKDSILNIANVITATNVYEPEHVRVGIGWGTATLPQFSLDVNGTVRGVGAFNTASDKRIKKEITMSNTAEDLSTLQKIKITNYRMIDTTQGSKWYKKVIAQQVDSVYGIAVTQTSGDYVPSVYAKASKHEVVKNTDTGTHYRIKVDKVHNFAVGDEAKLYYLTDGMQREEHNRITKIVDKNTFEVCNKGKYASLSGIFVYGKQVNDFLNVDYDALATLNISATQELAKQLEAEKEKNAKQQKQIDELSRLVQQLLKK